VVFHPKKRFFERKIIKLRKSLKPAVERLQPCKITRIIKDTT